MNNYEENRIERSSCNEADGFEALQSWGITRVHLNIEHRQLNWAISMRIIYCLLCLEGRGCYDGRHKMDLIIHLEEATIYWRPCHS
jgi:hypothetical protein